MEEQSQVTKKERRRMEDQSQVTKKESQSMWELNQIKLQQELETYKKKYENEKILREEWEKEAKRMKRIAVPDTVYPITGTVIDYISDLVGSAKTISAWIGLILFLISLAMLDGIESGRISIGVEWLVLIAVLSVVCIIFSIVLPKNHVVRDLLCEYRKSKVAIQLLRYGFSDEDKRRS